MKTLCANVDLVFLFFAYFIYKHRVTITWVILSAGTYLSTMFMYI